MTLMPALELAQSVLRVPEDLRHPEAIVAISMLAVCGLITMAYAYLAASNMLAHTEENRSTNVRVLTTVSVLVGVGFCSWLLGYTPARVTDRGLVAAMGTTLLLLLSAPAIFFTTEFDTFGRRVRRQVPRRAGLAALAFPFLPGGGRGIALWALHAGLVTLFVLVAQADFPVGVNGFLDDGIGAYLALLAYCGVYLLLPSGLMAPFTHAPQLRAAVRVLVPFLVIVFAFAPALVGFFLDDRVLMRAQHAGNPFFVIGTLWRGDPRVFGGYLPFIGVLLGVGVLFSLVRLVRAVIEVVRVRRARIDDEARRDLGAPATDAVTEL